MTPSDTIEQQYQQGFNDGYVLAKYRPDISDSLQGLQPLSPRLEGMIDGREEYTLEQELEKQQEHLPEDPALDLEQDFTIDD